MLSNVGSRVDGSIPTALLATRRIDACTGALFLVHSPFRLVANKAVGIEPSTLDPTLSRAWCT